MLIQGKVGQSSDRSSFKKFSSRKQFTECAATKIGMQRTSSQYSKFGETYIASREVLVIFKYSPLKESFQRPIETKLFPRFFFHLIHMHQTLVCCFYWCIYSFLMDLLIGGQR